ncbi:MAG: hypothetical protein H0V17_29530 [Deltaproteobacteria bacterium]|nr:hypothetical protein [Deltaproteobacteria bacterium]
MKKLAILSTLLLALSVSTGCGKPNHEKACKHMIELATEELDAEIEKIDKLGGSKDFGKGLREAAAKSRDTDLATCASKMKEHDIDPDCINDADSLAEAQRCLKSR